MRAEPARICLSLRRHGGSCPAAWWDLSNRKQIHRGSCPVGNRSTVGAVQQWWELSSRVVGAVPQSSGTVRQSGESCPIGSRAMVGAVRPSSSRRRNAEWPESLPEAESQGEKGSNCCLFTQLSHQCLPSARLGQKSAGPRSTAYRGGVRMDLWANGTWLGTLQWQLCRGQVGWC